MEAKVIVGLVAVEAICVCSGVGMIVRGVRLGIIRRRIDRYGHVIEGPAAARAGWLLVVLGAVGVVTAIVLAWWAYDGRLEW